MLDKLAIISHPHGCLDATPSLFKHSSGSSTDCRTSLLFSGVAGAASRNLGPAVVEDWHEPSRDMLDTEEDVLKAFVAANLGPQFLSVLGAPVLTSYRWAARC